MQAELFSGRKLANKETQKPLREEIGESVVQTEPVNIVAAV